MKDVGNDKTSNQQDYYLPPYPPPTPTPSLSPLMPLSPPPLLLTSSKASGPPPPAHAPCLNGVWNSSEKIWDCPLSKGRQKIWKDVGNDKTKNQ